MPGPSVSASVLFKTALQGAAIKELLDGVNSIIDTTAEFSEQMSKVQAVSQTAGEELDRLSERARKLGANTRFTATEAGKGMEELARLGFDVEQIYSSVEDTLNLAASSAIGLGDASRITAGTINAFKLEADDATRVVDNLAVVAANSGADVLSLGEAMQEGGSIARTAGVPIEDYAAFVGVLGDSMIKGTKAGTGWRQFLIQLLNPSEKAKGALKELQLTQDEVNVSSIGLSPVLQTLREAFGNLASDSERASVAADLWGRRSFNAALVAVQGADRIDILINKMKEGEGTAKRMADVMTDNLGGSFKLFRSAMQEVALTIGTELTPNLRDLLGDLTATARGSSEAGNTLKTVGKVIGTVITSLNIAVKSLDLVANLLIAGFAKIISVVGQGIAEVNKLAAKGLRSLGLDDYAEELDSNASLVEDAMEDFFARFQPNIDKVGELALSIGDDWDLLRKTWKGGAESVASVDLTGVNDGLSNALENIKNVVSSGGQDLQSELQALRDVLNLKKLFEDVDPSELADEQKEGLEISLDQLIQLFKTAGVDLDAGIVEFRNSLTKVGDGVKDSADKVDEGTSRLSGTLSNLGSVITSSGEMIKASAGQISSAIADIVGFNKDEILEKAAALEGALQRISELNIQLDPDQKENLRKQIEEIVDEFGKIKENVPPIVEEVAKSFGILPQKFQEVGQSAQQMAGTVAGSTEEIDAAAKKVSQSINQMGGDFTLAGNRTEEGMRRSTKVVRELDETTGEVVTKVVSHNAAIGDSAETMGGKYEETRGQTDGLKESQEQVAESTRKGKEQIDGVSTAAASASENLSKAATATDQMATAGSTLESSLGTSKSIMEQLSGAADGLEQRLRKIAGITISPKVDLSGLASLISMAEEAIGKLEELEAKA